MASSQKLKTEDRNVTLRDVANALGVSKATVSLAINRSNLVARKTRDRILKKVEELGYVYNRSAAGLSTGQTRAAGLAVHDITNPYFSEVSAAIESVLSQNSMMSFLCNTNESLERQERFIQTLIEYRADGLILNPAAGTTVKSLQPLINRRLPTVLLTRDVKGAGIDFVGNDEFLALRLATEHLIGLGHHRIAMIGGGQRTSASKLRRAGYKAAMKENGLQVDSTLVIDCATNPKAGEKVVKKVMANKNPPTAIACFTDLVALGVISGLYQMGIMPGRDVAVVGCDDIEETGRFYVQLTTVKIQKWSIGQAAADMLMRRIADPDIPTQQIIMKPDLIIRSSCHKSVYPTNILKNGT
jgi:LacI family transcriptional regulator